LYWIDKTFLGALHQATRKRNTIVTKRNTFVLNFWGQQEERLRFLSIFHVKQTREIVPVKKIGIKKIKIKWASRK
jgi:hypothetical protein